MKRALFAAAFLAFAAPAFAADSLTITIVSDGTYAGTLSKTWKFSQADMNTFQAFLLDQYGTTCTVVAPATTCTPPANTVPSAALSWAATLVGGIVSSVKSWQTSTAQATAASGVTPLAPQ